MKDSSRSFMSKNASKPFSVGKFHFQSTGIFIKIHSIKFFHLAWSTKYYFVPGYCQTSAGLYSDAQ